MALAEADLSAEKIVMTTTYNERFLMTQVPGARYDGKRWQVPLSWASCVILRGLFGESLQIGELLRDWAWVKRLTRIEPAAALRDALDADTSRHETLVTIMKALDEVEAESPFHLYPYQRADVAFMISNGRSLLANEPGLGKTGSVIRWIQVMQRLGMDPLPVVISCPNSLKRTVWAQELEAWAPELKVTTVEGGAAARRKQLVEPADVWVLNWESLRLHSRLAPYGQTELTDAEKTAKELQGLGYRTAVFDESHKAKDPHAKQTRAAWAIAHQADYRVAMTGTPVANNLADLWSLLHLIEPTWFPAKTRWLDRYAIQSPSFYGGSTIVGVRADTKTELFSIIDPLMRRVPKTLALPQLPPKLPVQYRETPMSAKQAKAYAQMEKAMIAQLLNGELLMAPNPLSKLTRLLQFSASMAELDEEGRVRLVAPSSKVDDLVDLLEEMGEAPLVVAAVSRQLIEIAAERLAKEGITYGLVTGAQSGPERQAAVKRFQAGQDRVILLTLGAGAEGLTLTRADTILFMQRSYSVVQNLQAEDRVHRIGSEGHESIRIIEQITPGTLEERRLEVLRGKEDKIQEIVRDEQILRKLLGMKSD